MKRLRMKPIGWRHESHRHYLAAKGIKTRYYAISFKPRTSVGQFLRGELERGDVMRAAKWKPASATMTEDAAKAQIKSRQSSLVSAKMPHINIYGQDLSRKGIALAEQHPDLVKEFLRTDVREQIKEANDRQDTAAAIEAQNFNDLVASALQYVEVGRKDDLRPDQKRALDRAYDRMKYAKMENPNDPTTELPKYFVEETLSPDEMTVRKQEEMAARQKVAEELSRTYDRGTAEARKNA